MDQKALTPLAKDAYSYGAEQGFRLGYLAAGEVVTAALGERHWRIRDQLRDTLRRRFDEVAGRCMDGAPGEGWDQNGPKIPQSVAAWGFTPGTKCLPGNF